MKVKTSGLILLICIVLAVLSIFANNVMERKPFSTEVPKPTIALPTDLTRALLPIDVNTLRSIGELAVLPLDSGDVVIALSEGRESGFLQAVSESGLFTRWDITNLRVVKVQSLFFDSSPRHYNLPAYKMNAYVSFNNDGSLVLTPSEINSQEDITSSKLIKYIVWNTDSMERLSWHQDFDEIQILHPTSEVIISASSRNVSITFGFTGDSGGGGPIVERNENEPAITRIAIDPQGDYLAVSDEAGRVQIGDVALLKSAHLEDYLLDLFSPRANYRPSGLPKTNLTTVDLKFDPSHRWLAWLTDENIIIWSLQDFVFPLHLKSDIKNGNVICFDRTGEILVVGAKDELKFFSLAEKKQIAEYKVGGVTALYFTRDNRLLVWGDAQGVVHLWGVRE